MVFEKNANFFAENWRKSQKIVIITSTPGFNFSKFRTCKAKKIEIDLRFRPQ
jgi:hypothetical protein